MRRLKEAVLCLSVPLEDPHKNLSPARIQDRDRPLRLCPGCIDESLEHRHCSHRQTECLSPTERRCQTHADSSERSRPGGDCDQLNIGQPSFGNAMPRPGFFKCPVHHREQSYGVVVRWTVIRDLGEALMVTENANPSCFACRIKCQNQHRKPLYSVCYNGLQTFTTCLLYG